MNPTLIGLGITATLRAAQAGANLLGEHARDRQVLLPNLELPVGSRQEQLHAFLMENAGLAATDPEFIKIWDDANKELKTTDQVLIDPAWVAMLQHKARLDLLKDGKNDSDAGREAGILAAGHMIEQWRAERKPPSALIRMALTLTDIGLEFVAGDPTIFGIGSRGEKLIAAFAKNMSSLIPNDMETFGAKADFADRVLGIFLRAGLGSVTNNASLVFQDEDIAVLLAGVLNPIVEALPVSIAAQIHYRDLVDTLAGPSAEAALNLLAENTQTYLGKDFADGKALGAVTTALFAELTATTHNGNLMDAFSEQGLIRLYQAGLGIAVDRPFLFINDDQSAKTELFRQLLSGAAGVLRAHPRFMGPVGASMAVTVIEMVGRNAPARIALQSEEPWEKVALTVLNQITSGLANALNDLDAHGALKGALKSFSDAQLLALGRAILAQATQTPGMLGIARAEVQAIVVGMAAAMAADEHLLLSTDEWIKIAGIAARTAASDPGRLFGHSADDHVDGMFVPTIKSVLAVAGEAWRTSGRSGGALLFGRTLETAMEALITALTGDIAFLRNHPDIVNRFLKDLLTNASSNAEKFGSAGLLKVFRALIGNVLATGALPSAQEMERALSL